MATVIFGGLCLFVCLVFAVLQVFFVRRLEEQAKDDGDEIASLHEQNYLLRVERDAWKRAATAGDQRLEGKPWDKAAIEKEHAQLQGKGGAR